jgi:CHASE2 domain-containing sensor protein
MHAETPRRAQLRGMALAATVAVLFGSLAYATHLWERVEGDSVDLRFSLRGHQPTGEVAVVAIDDVTFAELRQQWPFPRSLHARAIDRLRALGAKKIVYDVQFTEPTTAREDLALYHAIRRARGVILATTEVDERGRTNVLGGDANVARAHARAAASNLPSDRGGVIRRFTYSVSGLQTMAVVAASELDRPLSRADLRGGGAWIDYRGPPRTIPTVSFGRLLRGDADPRLLREKVVVVGASAPTLQDVHPTPTSGKHPMSGPEIQANAVWTALHGLPLRSAPWWLDLLAIWLLGLAAPLAGIWMRALRTAAVALLALLAYAVLAWQAFDSGLILTATYPMASLLLGTVGTIVGGYVVERREHWRMARYSEALESEVRKRTQELRDTQLEIVRRLGQAAESRDEETGHHVQRMSQMCHRLGIAAGMSVEDAELLRDASALHDLGKIGIPDHVLLNPAKYSPEEQEIMRTHTTIGASILAGSQLPLVRTAEVIAATHHERWDGTGYPAGLKGEEIPLVGRICAICDVFDALMSKRRYKERWTLESAIAEIRAQSGKGFDPRLVEVFLSCAPQMYRELMGQQDEEPPPASLGAAEGTERRAPAPVLK